MKKYFFFAVCIIVSALTSCGVESLTVDSKLASPLGVALTNVGNNSIGIVVRFWAYNNETYFSGYNIYIATNAAILQNGTGFWVARADGTASMPTVPYSPMTTASLISFTVTNYTNSASLSESNFYYFYVTAYSATYSVESLPSNITNIQYLTN
jgi:hypothetical protein